MIIICLRTKGRPSVHKHTQTHIMHSSVGIQTAIKNVSVETQTYIMKLSFEIQTDVQICQRGDNHTTDVAEFESVRNFIVKKMER